MAAAFRGAGVAEVRAPPHRSVTHFLRLREDVEVTLPRDPAQRTSRTQPPSLALRLTAGLGGARLRVGGGERADGALSAPSLTVSRPAGPRSPASGSGRPVRAFAVPGRRQAGSGSPRCPPGRFRLPRG